MLNLLKRCFEQLYQATVLQNGCVLAENFVGWPPLMSPTQSTCVIVYAYGYLEKN